MSNLQTPRLKLESGVLEIGDCRLEIKIADWRLNTGYWRLEIGNWRLEIKIGDWRSEIGD